MNKESCEQVYRQIEVLRRMVPLFFDAVGVYLSEKENRGENAKIVDRYRKEIRDAQKALRGMAEFYFNIQLERKEFIEMTVTIGDKSEAELAYVYEMMKFMKSLYLQAFKEKMRSMLPNPREEIDLVLVRAEDLGLTPESTQRQLYDRAKECGLELVPPEVALQLVLSDREVLTNEMFTIGMNPLFIEGDPVVLSVSLKNRKIDLFNGDWDVVQSTFPTAFRKPRKNKGA